MRAGWVVSFIGHVGFVIMTMLAWEARTTLAPAGVVAVPVEIVDIAAESNVRALAEDVPDEDVTPEQQEETTAALPERGPSPNPPARRRDEFNPNDAEAALRNYDRRTGRRREVGETSDRNRQGAGLGTAEVAALEGRLAGLMQRAMQRCWRMPLDQPDSERLIVTLEFDLDRNGNVRGPPRVTSPRNYTFDPPMRVAVDSAVRAVLACDPYPFPTDPQLGDHYEIWNEIEFTFTPR
jgi:hypothetical protein